jgi:hypothetical protein
VGRGEISWGPVVARVAAELAGWCDMGGVRDQRLSRRQSLRIRQISYIFRDRHDAKPASQDVGLERPRCDDDATLRTRPDPGHVPERS